MQLTEKSFAKNRNSAPDFDKQEVGKGRLYFVSKLLKVGCNIAKLTKLTSETYFTLKKL